MITHHPGFQEITSLKLFNERRRGRITSDFPCPYFLHSLACRIEAFSDCGQRNSKALADFLIRIPFPVKKLNHSALVLRKVLQTVANPSGLRRIFNLWSRLIGPGFRHKDLDPPIVLANDSMALTVYNAPKPPRKSRRPVQLVDISIDREKGLLHNIFRQLPVC